MIQTLEKLSKVLPLARVKPRLDPKGMGNKTILVNVIVEDSTIKPKLYPWSKWWDKQVVRMVAEVRIFNLFFLVFLWLL